MSITHGFEYVLAISDTHGERNEKIVENILLASFVTWELDFMPYKF